MNYFYAILILTLVLFLSCSSSRQLTNEQIVGRTDYCRAHGMKSNLVFEEGAANRPTDVVCVPYNK